MDRIIVLGVTVLFISIGFYCFYFKGPVLLYAKLRRKIRFAASFSYLWLWHSRKPMFQFECHSQHPSKVGITSLTEARLRENPRQLQNNLNAMDSTGFSGTSHDGHVLVVRMSRRHDRCSEVIVYLRLSSGEEYQLPAQPDCHVYNTDGRTFTAAGLTFDALEPLRRWKIAFNGSLRKGTRDNWNHPKDEIVPVRFNFLWKPLNDYLGFPNDFKTKILANILAKESTTFKQLFQNPVQMFDQEWHEQYGQVHGTLSIGGQEEMTLMLRGLKDRRHGVEDWNASCKKISIKGVTEHGMCFHLFSEKKDNCISLDYGYFSAPCNTITRHVSSWNEDLKEVAIRDTFNMKIKAEDRDYELKMKWNKQSFRVFHGQNWTFQNTIRFFKFKLNDKKGYGFVEIGEPYLGNCPIPKQKSLPQLIEPDIERTDMENNEQFVVTFNDLACQSRKIVGGKGSSLALMTTLHSTMDNRLVGGNITNFEIPRGVCVTNTAFCQHLADNPSLDETIKSLEAVAWKRTEGSLNKQCDRLVELLQETQVSSLLETELESGLLTVFGNDYLNMKYAIRSSAIGEDGKELSAAGQNESFLGVKGIEKICKAVVNCWASQFSYRSIEYKRQNGQLLHSGMGVVVQQMIDADVAGVLFTNHPVTGSQSHMMISSNYGLGETVVSGCVDPDTVLLERSMDNKLQVVERYIGKKNLKISMTVHNGLTRTNISPEQASKITLQDKLVVKLGKIAIYLEKSYGNAQDLEWAVRDNKIYLLQSRPVTTENNLTDFDVIHEFDTPMRTDTEVYSTANSGEVMPGTRSTLTSTSSARAISLAIVDVLTYKFVRQRYEPMTNESCEFYGHSFFSPMQERLWDAQHVDDSTCKEMDLMFFGRSMNEGNIIELAIERADNPPKKVKNKMSYQILWGMLFAKNLLQKCHKQFSNYPICGSNETTASGVYNEINKHLCDMKKVTKTHLEVSIGSYCWNTVILRFLSKKEDNIEKYAHFATLVGSSIGAESGDAPFGILRLATAISQDNDSMKFCNMSSTDALKWLQTNDNEAGKTFVEFMERHGHRGYKEVDVFSLSWDMQPENLMKVLQDTLKSGKCHVGVSKELGKDDFLNKLKQSLSPLKRWTFSWILSNCKTGVCQREVTKSLLVKVVDSFRKGYRHLASLMVTEGLLPEEDLLFFMTHEEIGQYIESRSVKLLRRSKQRKRLYKYKDRLQFPDVIIGFPKPIETIDVNFEASGLTEVTGLTVSHGLSEGPARVILSYDEVHTIQPGDILITHATDIGWSPYFPMLAGVVTEIGGLISHGAVVAREFGLPCIVGAQNATKSFKSGEIVLLNATKGTIGRVERK